MPPRTGRARRWAALGALPLAAAALCVLLLCGAFATPHPLPWALLLTAAVAAVARWGLSAQRRADVHPVAGQGVGNLADNAGSILADQFEQFEGRFVSQGSRLVWEHDHGQTLGRKATEGIGQWLFLFGGDLDAQDAGELTSQTSHSALEPIATVGRNLSGQPIH